MLRLERRPSPSQFWTASTPLLAVVLTMLAGGAMFALLGTDPLAAIRTIFWDPVFGEFAFYYRGQLLVKAAPLILIAIGLSLGFRAGIWNIGAEGQLVMGAIAGSAIPVLLPGWQSPLALAAMLALGAAGGALYGAIPAWLKNRFNTNEILTSLMLVYVAQLFLDWLVRGPWRDPKGFNFPKSVAFEGWQIMPTMAGRVHLGAILALLAVAVLWLVMSRMLHGFEIRVMGSAPRAGLFCGFSPRKMTYAAFVLSGAMAGLAGIGEVAGPIGQLQPSISPGYGFTAIIVAWLARLNPLTLLIVAYLFGGLLVGGDAIQPAGIPLMIQGIILFCVISADVFTRYRLRLVRTAPVEV